MNIEDNSTILESKIHNSKINDDKYDIYRIELAQYTLPNLKLFNCIKVPYFLDEITGNILVVIDNIKYSIYYDNFLPFSFLKNNIPSLCYLYYYSSTAIYIIRDNYFYYYF